MEMMYLGRYSFWWIEHVSLDQGYIPSFHGSLSVKVSIEMERFPTERRYERDWKDLEKF